MVVYMKKMVFILGSMINSLKDLKSFKQIILRTFLLIFVLLSISCSEILFSHDDAMSMLNSKELVLKRFGEPNTIRQLEKYSEYYYDFGEFREQINYFDPKISLMTRRIDSLSYVADFESQSQYSIKVSKKYILFHIVGDSVKYWESQNVNFPIKRIK